MYNFKKHFSNYHTHTWLCRHAKGEVIDYVKEAIKHNYYALGISDHAPFELLSENGSVRMSLDEFYHDYLVQFQTAKKFIKNLNFRLYCGLEIEYLPSYENHFNLLLNDLDYLILGQHYIFKNNKLVSTYNLKTLEDIILYRDMLIEAVKTNYFSMVCHPDLAFYGIKNPTEEMYEAFRPFIKECVKRNIPLEINANGIRRNFSKPNNNRYDPNSYSYPQLRFWEIASEEGANGIISSDAHDPMVLHDEAIEIAYEFARKVKINLIKDLDIIKKV